MPRHFPAIYTAMPVMLLFASAPSALILPLSPLQAEDGSMQRDDGPGSGTLMLRGPGVADALPATRLGTDMDVTVSGDIARVRVTQAFRNTSSGWVEATYLFPLPADAAVDGLKMIVGRRVIVGHIEKRAAARAMYEKARTKGQKAGLVEQQRPNMFSTSVANVGPGETMLVAIEYQAPVARANGTFSLRLPLVVAPRYVPPHTLATNAGRADAQAVTASPVMDPRAKQEANPTSITVHLAPGFPLANLISRYHRVAISGTGQDRTITLAKGDVPADRDFELDWRSAAADPIVGLFRQHVGAQDYVMATIVPPSDTSHLPSPPREMVFVIDNSGSMGGTSMDEAKDSLVHALATLGPRDLFNIIRFDDTMTRLFPHSVRATPDALAAAARFAKGLEAAGGTEMLPALRAALADAGASGDAATLRQIIFLTDGEISNEQEMLAALGHDAGRSHVFMVGIGSAPNDHLMTRMATLGRGTYTHVGSGEEVAARMMPLLDTLRHPAMQDIAVTVAGVKIDLTPSTLPDLYPGQPLVLLGRGKAGSGTITVSGRIGDRRWEQRLDLAGAAPSTAVAKSWGRRRIDDVEADRSLGRITDEAADAAIAGIGLEHGLVTSQTSLIAVDETPSRPIDQPLRREDLPLDLPAGWDFTSLFGRDAGAIAPAGKGAPSMADAPTALDLPQTATNYFVALVEGLALLVAGAAGLLLRRRWLAR